MNGFQVHTQLDEATLQRISTVTDGTYYGATDAQQLRSIYDNLDTRLVIQPELTEITALFAGASLLLLIAGALTLARLAGSAAMSAPTRLRRHREGRR